MLPEDVKLGIKQLAVMAEHIDAGWFTQDYYSKEFDKLAGRLGEELGCSVENLPPITEPRFQREAATAARAIVARFSIRLVTGK